MLVSDILLDTEEVRLQQAFQGAPGNDEGEKGGKDFGDAVLDAFPRYQSPSFQVSP